MQPPKTPLSRGARYQKMRRCGYLRMVDATVTVRMIRALRRIGYSNKAIAAGAGLSHQNIVGNLANNTNPGPRQKVYRETAEAIADFYWAHHNKPRLDADGRRMATWAAKRGWAPPAAYDRIDDIKERPKGVVAA